ncbi:MAG TPA: amidase [Polyangia bacterium]|jgi:Asp-tRNA(Asn)/Glu-tRNA(Gln) amidotransferase A subunit family amidase
MPSRRQFLSRGALGLAGLAVGGRARGDKAGKPADLAAPVEATAPPAFGTAPSTGPAVSAATFAEAEKLVQVTMTPKERALAASNWRQSMAALIERRVGPRRVALGAEDVPATVWNPSAAADHAARAQSASAGKERFVRSRGAAPPLPARDEDIAFAPLTTLSRWIETKKLTSERLTSIYLSRLERFQPKLLCSITIVRDAALAAARRADAEIARGKYRGPLHGVPWGAKDLLDTAGIATTWGAEPFANRVPATDATVVKRLADAGAVLVAKLSLGALALNDVWFGGQTKNPWNLDEGSSGSSAGPGAATAAGLVGFAIGSETLGSIVSPSTRCGVAGLRPTFGRVPRTGAMALCWSLDKLGPMARGVEDTALVLRALSGPDAADPSTVASRLDFDGNAPVRGLRVGFFPAWMKKAPATPVDSAALEHLRGAGCVPVEVALPDWPYDSLATILFAESAASFEELTLSRGVDQLKMQVADGWPNTFRQSRFLSAVDFVQADRLRRKVAVAMAELFAKVDVLLVPSFSDMLTISNFTGHPSLTVRAGFVEIDRARDDFAPNPAHPLPTFKPPRRVPHGTTLIGRLFDEGTLVRVGMALERAAGVAHERPPGFDRN